MTVFEQLGDGATPGAAVDASNSAGALSSAFSSVVTTNGSLVWDNTYPLLNALPMRARGAGSGVSYGVWTINGTEWRYRGYTYLPTAPDVEIYLAFVGVGATRSATLSLLATTGRIVMRNASGTSVGGAGTVNFPLGRWVLVEWKGTVGSSTGTSSCVFYDVDGVTPLDSRSASGANFGASNLTTFRVGGRASTSSQTVDVYTAAVKVADAGATYFGPFTTPYVQAVSGPLTTAGSVTASTSSTAAASGPLAVTGSVVAATVSTAGVSGPLAVAGSVAAVTSSTVAVTGPASLQGSASAVTSSRVTVSGPLTVAGSVTAETPGPAVTVSGPLALAGSAAAVTVSTTSVAGPTIIGGAAAAVTVFSTQIAGPLTLAGSTMVVTSSAATVAGLVTIGGSAAAVTISSTAPAGPLALAGSAQPVTVSTVTVAGPIQLGGQVDAVTMAAAAPFTVTIGPGQTRSITVGQAVTRRPTVGAGQSRYTVTVGPGREA